MATKDIVFGGVKSFCGDFQPLSAEDPAPHGVVSQHLTFHFFDIVPIGASGPTFF